MMNVFDLYELAPHLSVISKSDLPESPDEPEKLRFAFLADEAGLTYVWLPDASPKGWVIFSQSEARSMF